MISVENLTKRYPGKTAVDGISFNVGQGEIVGLLGPNGAGKSTTMRMITGFLPPTEGRASVAGYDVFHQSIQARRQIGYMPEDVPLYTDMRVREYLDFRARLKGLKGQHLKRRLNRVIELCGLGTARRQMIGNLSKGYRQRVGLADALIHEPPLLILDEPTNGLDPTQIRQVREMIRELGKKHTILLSSHILREVEAVCQRVIIIHKGIVRADGPPSEITQSSHTLASLRIEIKDRAQSVKEKLNQIEGIKRINVLEKPDDGWDAYEILLPASLEIRDQISEMALNSSWQIREISRRQPSLEERFVELTQAD